MADGYDLIPDEELILRIRDGELQIIDFIMEKYKNLAKSKSRSMFILGADNDDLIQEGMIGLFKAIRDYDTGRDASFYTFAELCITRQIYTAIQASNRQKHVPLNTSISLSAEHTVELQQEDGNPESIMIDQESGKALEKMIAKELSLFEKQVLELYLTGMTYTEIAKVLNKDQKSTDNALQRIKGKVKKVITP